MFDPGLKRADIEQALGADFVGTIPNNYRLVREAIDRGVPLDEVKAGNNITAQLRKLMLPQGAAKAAMPAASGLMKKLSLSMAK
jgi:pilus assembly protein CpaE